MPGRKMFPAAPVRHFYVGCGGANPHVSHIVHAYLKKLEQAAATFSHQQNGKTFMC